MKVIIFKPVEICNSNCIYCDVVKKGSHAIMSYQLLELVFSRFNEFLECHPDESLQLIWHGGEPCLLGVDYFKKAIEIQNRICKNTKTRIEHAIQSNLTLISQEFLEVFRKLGIEMIGTSYEPIPHMRGPGENRDSEQYNRKFLEGIRLLEKNNFNWGVIYVITRKSLDKPLDIFYFLTNFKLNVAPCLNPVKIFDKDVHNLAISPHEIADWLGTIYQVWYKHRDRFPHVRPFQSLTESIENKKFSLGCEDSGHCAYNWIYIGPEGKTSHCGRSGDYDLLAYGNIRDKTLDEIFNDKQRDLINNRSKILPETECKECRFWGLCHGGCPLDAYMKHKDFNHRYPNCEARKILFEKYIEPVTGIKADFRYTSELEKN